MSMSDDSSEKKILTYTELSKETPSEKYDIGVVYDGNDRIITIKNHCCSKELWIFLILSIVVLIVCFFIAYPEQGWYSDLPKSEWSENVIIWAILLVITVLIMTFSTSFAYSMATITNKSAIMITFIASLILLIAWFTVFYRSKDLNIAFYLSLALIFVLIVQTYFVWLCDTTSGIGMLPYIVFLIFLSWASWDISLKNVV